MSGEQNQGVSFLAYVLAGVLLLAVGVPFLCCFGSALIGAFQ